MLPESSSRPLPAALAQSRNLAHASLKTAVQCNMSKHRPYWQIEHPKNICRCQLALSVPQIILTYWCRKKLYRLYHYEYETVIFQKPLTFASNPNQTSFQLSLDFNPMFPERGGKCWCRLTSRLDRFKAENGMGSEVSKLELIHFELARRSNQSS